MKRPAAPHLRPGNRRRRFTPLAGWLAAGLLCAGVLQAADAPPGNVFTRAAVLPPHLRRVAVLPLAADGPDASLADGCELLKPVLFDELVRTEKFEAVYVRPEHLRASSGRAAWTGTEPLPKGFFDLLRREYGCEAVLFCELTTFHAYAPMAVGWRLKLADARTQKIIWAADAVFDAGQTPVSRKAWRFVLGRAPAGEAAEARWRSLNSPRQFGSSTAAQLLSRLPAR